MLKLGIHGAAGRMGARLVDLGSAGGQFEIVAAVEAPGHPALGTDAGQLAGRGELGLAITDHFGDQPQVVIDFSTPEGAVAAIDYCRQQQIPLVMATTGLDEATGAVLEALAKEIPVVWAPSMSLAVNLSFPKCVGCEEEQPMKLVGFQCSVQ